MSDLGSAGPVVVTGGTGFIGWSLCERMRDAGHEVRAAVRASSGNPLPEGVVRLDADLDAQQLRPVCQGARVVYHLAGLTRAVSREAFLRVNAEGARQAALAARAAGAFFVLVSSQAAAGPGTRERPRRESDRPAPVSDYGRSKLEGERAVAAVEGLEYTIVRPPGVYGPRDTDFLALFRMARSGFFPLLGDPAKAYTLVHVEDVVTALGAIGGAGAADAARVTGEIFFLGHPRPVDQLEMAGLLAEVFERTVRRVRVPGPLLRLIAEVGEWQAKLSGQPALVNRSRYRELTAPGFVCEVDKLRERLGVEAGIDPAEGFARTAEWYRRQNWL